MNPNLNNENIVHTLEVLADGSGDSDEWREINHDLYWFTEQGVFAAAARRIRELEERYEH